MGALSALSTTGRTLKRNGVLFAAAFAVTFVSLAPSGASSVLPPAAAAVASIAVSGLSLFVTPFLMGGMLSMAAEALDGSTRFDTFVSGGKEHYVRLLGSMVLFAVGFGILGFVVLVVGVMVAIFVVGSGPGAAGHPFALSAGAIGGLVAFGLVAALVLLLPVFFFQFYAAAIVVSDLGIVESFQRSAALVRRNLVSTLGYFVVAIAVGGVTGIGGVGVSTLLGPGGTSAVAHDLDPGLVAGLLVVLFAVSAVISAFGSVYQVAFYDDCLDSLA